MQSERMAEIIQEMRMARTEFPFAYEIGRKDAPEEFDADGLMVKPRTIVIEKVTIETLADRIEKAWEREKSQPIGNAAAMREALRACLDFIMRLDRAFNPFMQNLLENAIAKAKAALAAPPRNCDVGTAEEQAERYMKFCKNYPKCTGCPCVGRMQYHQCELAWAQMPYTEGGAK